MENYKSISEREPTPYPINNNLKNVSELGPLNSIIIPPLKKALELVNSEVKNTKIPPPAPVEAPPAPVEAHPAPVQEPPAPVQEPPAPVQEPPTPVQEPPAPVQEPKNSNIPSLIEAEQLSKQREHNIFKMPTPFEENIANDSVQPQKEIIIEEYIIKKPKMPLLEEESMASSLQLIPNIRRSSKLRSKSKSPDSSQPEKKTRKYKRCSKNHRRSKKTHRCNKNCPPGHKKSSISKRCVKKDGKK